VEEPANPHARIEYVNYMAKGNDDYSKCLNEVGGDKVDFCKWISAVYRDYGFSDVVEAIKAVMGMLEGRTGKTEPGKIRIKESVKAEGAVTTGTPNAYNPIYGDKPEAQINLEQDMASEEPNPSDNLKEEEPKPRKRKRKENVEEEGEALEGAFPEPKPEEKEPSGEEKELLELISRLVGELRELLNTIREVGSNASEEN